MNTNQYEQEAHEMIDHIFQEILPNYGMAERPAQIKLSHEMLEAMLGGKIALCDAGTGIGKTYAYLVAGAVADRCRGTKPFQPILISTSSIALQSAVQEEYLPKLSHALLLAGLIDAPLQAVVRKGKSHYVCDKLLEKRLHQVSGAKKNAKALAALEALRESMDMDRVAHLSHYNKERVCVPQVCHCDREDCRYQRFLHGCETEQFLFQICNHNLFLADAIHREQGKRPIFPSHSIAILDEAHKLPETARQMFGVMLTAGQIQELIEELQNAKYLLAAETLEQTAKPLLEKLAQPREETEALEESLRLLAPLTRSMPIVQRQVGKLLPSPGRKRMDTLASAVALFSRNDSEMLFYLAEEESGGTMLCATPADLTAKLRQTLWRTECSFVLTSGTLAVGNDFQRYRTQVGLREERRVQESVARSPFDYHEHCLRYLPLFPPKQRAGQEEEYFDELTAEIMDLLKASYGHALVLFTSYAAMSAVKDRLQKEILRVPLFTLGRNAVHILEEFRATPGSVLLATGAAWEGIDFPGDGVSLLIIPRLPFAYPDALKEKEQEHYPSLPAFLEAVAVPEMQIKLRQGFGRAIRTEQDTCVIAILDDRAGQGRRYAQATKQALPEMRTTSSLRMVTKFLRTWKAESYFEVLT